MKARVQDEDELAPVDDTIIARTFRWSMAGLLVVGALALVLLFLLYNRGEKHEIITEQVITGPEVRTVPVAAAPPQVRFTDITGEAGIDFVHVNGAYGDKLLPETMGGGVAFIDYDNDGDQDLLFVNSTYWPGHAPDGTPEPFMALYRNDGSGAFADVTRESGLDTGFYGTGVAFGDYDNDGFDDLFIGAVGKNHLFHNDGGVFREVTATAGVAGDADDWSTSSAFLDYDNDGDLDLFVANYVRWTKEIDFEIDFRLTGIGRAYGPPTTFAGSYPYLYRNEGDGTFTDVSAEAGVRVDNPATGQPMAKALAVGPVDVDGDGWIDLLVANDTVQNFLYHNLDGKGFEEVGTAYGVAFDRNGAATGAMGVDAAYYRNDEDLGFVVGNFANEMTSFYVTQGGTIPLADEAIVEGIGPASRQALTFGVFFFDYDLDGRLDLFQSNGHLEEEINVVQPSQHYEQPSQLFWNCGEECGISYVEVPVAETGDLGEPVVGRGAAFGDIDNDGDPDIVITQAGRRPLLLRNDQQTGHHWLRVKLAGKTANRDGIGAWIEVSAGGRTQRRQVMPTRSYLSQAELPVTFGLGDAASADAVRVSWPDGTRQTLTGVAADALLVVEQEQQEGI
jgi:hypothetical protein